MRTTRTAMYGWRAGALTALLLVPLHALWAPPRALAQQNSSTAAVKAQVVQPTRRRVTRQVSLPANIAPDEQVDLFAKASGYVGSIEVDIGSRVKRGDLLVKIDVPEMLDEMRQAESLVRAKDAKVRALRAKAVQAGQYVKTAKAEVQQYIAMFNLKEINLKRKRELHEGNAIPAQALDEALSDHAITEAQLAIAQAKVAGAKAEQQAVEADVQVAEAGSAVAKADQARLTTLMSYTEIRAPFDGVITMRNVDHGAFVRSAAEGTTQALLQIAKIDSMRIVMEIAEDDVRYVHPGTTITVTIGALGGQPIPGAITRTAGALNPRTRTMRAEADLDNTDNKLTAGMYAIVVVNLESKEQAMMVPSKAIRTAGKEMVVFVVNDGVAQARPISIGYDDGIWAEILSGLDGNEAVITATSGAVTAGSPVVAVHAGS